MGRNKKMWDQIWCRSANGKSDFVNLPSTYTRTQQQHQVVGIPCFNQSTDGRWWLAVVRVNFKLTSARHVGCTHETIYSRRQILTKTIEENYALKTGPREDRKSGGLVKIVDTDRVGMFTFSSFYSDYILFNFNLKN